MPSHRPYLNDRRILSVQSHVVSGYVGALAALFALLPSPLTVSPLDR